MHSVPGKPDSEPKREGLWNQLHSSTEAVQPFRTGWAVTLSVMAGTATLNLNPMPILEEVAQLVRAEGGAVP
ncbi:hypothetical protein SM139_3591 [Stenotrophomonas maltophilia]|nr:hypothetical protein SM139_3591 [Stenotrophomonas maltophilia]